METNRFSSSYIPTSEEVESYLALWQTLPDYKAQQEALDQLFLDICKNKKTNFFEAISSEAARLIIQHRVASLHLRYGCGQCTGAVKKLPTSGVKHQTLQIAKLTINKNNKINENNFWGTKQQQALLA